MKWNLKLFKTKEKANQIREWAKKFFRRWAFFALNTLTATCWLRAKLRCYVRNQVGVALGEYSQREDKTYY